MYAEYDIITKGGIMTKKEIEDFVRSGQDRLWRIDIKLNRVEQALADQELDKIRKKRENKEIEKRISLGISASLTTALTTSAVFLAIQGDLCAATVTIFLAVVSLLLLACTEVEDK